MYINTFPPIPHLQTLSAGSLPPLLSARMAPGPNGPGIRIHKTQRIGGPNPCNTIQICDGL